MGAAPPACEWAWLAVQRRQRERSPKEHVDEKPQRRRERGARGGREGQERGAEGVWTTEGEADIIEPRLEAIYSRGFYTPRRTLDGIAEEEDDADEVEPAREQKSKPPDLSRLSERERLVALATGAFVHDGSVPGGGEQLGLSVARVRGLQRAFIKRLVRLGSPPFEQTRSVGGGLFREAYKNEEGRWTESRRSRSSRGRKKKWTKPPEKLSESQHGGSTSRIAL